MIWRRSFDPRSIGNLVLWLDDSQAVGQWSAKIGPHATQTATNNQPAVSSRNSRPVLAFDGINDTLSFPGISLSGWHAFAVVNSAVPTPQAVLSIASSSTQAFVLSSSALGRAVVAASGGPLTAQALDSRIGARWDGGALKGFYKGSIGEVLVYDAPLTSDQATAVTRYLSAKWGI